MNSTDGSPLEILLFYFFIEIELFSSSLEIFFFRCVERTVNETVDSLAKQGVNGVPF